MDKQQFLDKFGPRIRTQISVKRFFDEDISLTKTTVSATEIKKYFIPVFDNDGKRDAKKIEEQINDLGLKPVTVNRAIKHPAKWGMEKSISSLPAKLYEIVVATDLNSGTSILMDSNHTVINLLKEKVAPDRFEIIRIAGNHLENLVPDFNIINRVHLGS